MGGSELGQSQSVSGPLLSTENTHTQTHTTLDSLIIQSGPNVNLEIAVYSLKSIFPQVFLNRMLWQEQLGCKRELASLSVHHCLCRQTQTFETRIYVYTNTRTHTFWANMAMALPYAGTGGCSHSVSNWISLLRIKQWLSPHSSNLR